MATKILTWQELAQAIGAPDERKARSRWFALGFWEWCGRCGGGGHYSFNLYAGTTCFGCGGTGKRHQKPTPARVADAVAKIKAGGLDAYFAENNRRIAIRRELKAVKAECKRLYSVVGDAYSAAHDASRRRENRVELPRWLFDLQGRNNAVFFERLPAIETALEAGGGTLDDAAPFFEAAREALREIVAEYEATVAASA